MTRVRRVVATGLADPHHTTSLPVGADAQDADEWLRAALPQVLATTEHWQQPQERFATILANALEHRSPDDVLDLLLWPPDEAVTGMIRVSVYDAQGVEDAAQRLAGTAVSRLDGIETEMGPGLEWLYAVQPEIVTATDADGSEAELEVTPIGWQALLAGEDVDVLFTLEPVSPMVLPVLIDDVRVFAQSFALEIDGAPWRSLEIAPRVVEKLGDTWPVEQDS